VGSRWGWVEGVVAGRGGRWPQPRSRPQPQPCCRGVGRQESQQRQQRWLAIAAHLLGVRECRALQRGVPGQRQRAVVAPQLVVQVDQAVEPLGGARAARVGGGACVASWGGAAFVTRAAFVGAAPCGQTPGRGSRRACGWVPRPVTTARLQKKAGRAAADSGPAAGSMVSRHGLTPAAGWARRRPTPAPLWEGDPPDADGHHSSSSRARTAKGPWARAARPGKRPILGGLTGEPSRIDMNRLMHPFFGAHRPDRRQGALELDHGVKAP
jgi:hypothetical protein